MPYSSIDKKRKWKNDWARRRTEFIGKIKESTPCADCGVRYPAIVMDFDHVSSDKIKAVSVMRLSSMDALLTEIDKCEIVCANCHRLRTNARLVQLVDTKGLNPLQ